MYNDIASMENHLDRLEIAQDEVHVWQIPQKVPLSQANQSNGVLSPLEQARADLFRFNTDRSSFITIRTLVRIILGRYIHVPADCLRFASNDYGKPMLLGQTDPHPIHFNLSHSHDISLLAVARGRHVGVDVERCREVDLDDIPTPEIFSVREVQELSRLPVSKRMYAFYIGWTLKEAFAKATGYGLGFPMPAPEFGYVFAESTGLVIVPWVVNRFRGWSLFCLEIHKAYVGALTVEGHNWKPRFSAFGPKAWGITSKAFTPVKTIDCQCKVY